METDSEAHESLFYFIKWNGNEDNLTFLSDQLDEIENFEDGREMHDGINMFDIDIENFVSVQTATELCKVELNSVSYHRRFDGKMDRIDFGFSSDSDEYDMLVLVHDTLAYGAVEEFVEDEFVIPEHIDTDDLEVFSSDDESLHLIGGFNKL